MPSTLRKKRLISTLNELKEDIEWIKEEMSEKDRDSNETHEDDQNENSDVHLSNQTEEKRYESEKDRDSNETHEDDQNENSDVHLSNQTEEMRYECEKDRDSNETHEDDQNENSDVHLSNQTEEKRYESEKDRDSNETHEDDQNENSDVHLSNQTEEMRYESEKDRDSNETHEDDQNENSDVHLSNQTESETDDDSQQNTVDCDADSDYVPDSEDECENLEALPAFLNAVMKETGTESNDIDKDSDLKEKPYERKKKLKEEEKIRDSKCNGIYIKKYQKTDDGVYGQKKDSRPYDTVHACKFCYKLCTHIQDHLEKHNDNKEVQSIIKLQRDMKKVDNKGPLKKEIKRLQDCLRFEGDHLHNLKVKEFKEGELLIQRKACSKEEFNFLEYGPCSECLQWIKLESSVFNHQKNCPKRDVSSKSDSKNSLIWQARILTGEVETSGSEIFKKEVLVKMRKDAVSDCAKGDFMIRNLGEVWLAISVDHKLRRARIASFQMRLASRLVLECRKRLKNDCLSMFDLLRIKNFDLVADATLHLCGKNEDDDLRSPSVATKVGFDLVRLAGLKGTYCLRQGDADERKEAKGFLTLMKVEWSTKVTRLVNSLIRQRHFENRRKLPHPKDIETVASNLSEKLEKYDYKDKSQFVLVARTVLMRLMVYNRRRSGEMEELLIKTYMERNRGIDDVEEALLGELTYTEKYLIRSQELMWIRGKRGKPVPVLIPPDASKALEYLVDKETRQLAGRKPDNRYLFATNGDGVIYVSQCLKEHGFEHADKLIHPERLTSTGYRAYMATIAQCIGLKDHQIQWLCTHLGHTENVHMTNYRFTLEGIERIQMGKLLLMQDKNLLPNYKGMSLEEIEFEDIVSKMESQPQPRIDGNGAEMDVDDESFPGTADSDAHEEDLLSDVTMNGMKPRKNKSKQQVGKTDKTVEKRDKEETGTLLKNSCLDRNQNLKSLESSNTSNADVTPVVARKGGVEQFDFRCVLKNTSQTSRTQNKTDKPRLKIPSDANTETETDFRRVLKHTVNDGEDDKFSERQKKVTDIIGISDVGKSKEIKTNFQTDFRKVLKHRDHAVTTDLNSDPDKKPTEKLSVNWRLKSRKPVSLYLNPGAKVTQEKKGQTWSEIYSTKREPGHPSLLSQQKPSSKKTATNVQNISNTSLIETKEIVDFRRVHLKKTRTDEPHDNFTKKEIPGKLNGQPISDFLQKFENNQKSAKDDFRNILKHPKVNTLLTKDESRSRKMESDISNENHSSVSDKLKITKKNDELIKESVLTFTDKTIIAKIEEELNKSPDMTEKPEPRLGMTKPEFKTKMEDKTVPYGSEVILECQGTGKPDPDVTWSINNKEIKKSKFFQMSYQNTIARLIIAETFSEDEGEYKCTATNTQGLATCSCDLHVQGCPSPAHKSEDESEEEESEKEESEEEVFSPTVSPPKIYDISPSKFCIIRGRPIEFRASFSSVPQGTVKWLLNKQEIVSDDRVKVDTSEHFSTLSIREIEPGDSGRIDVIVENDIGSDTAFASLTVQDVPDPPVGCPSISDVTLTSVTLSWYGPAYDGGCPITNYRVEMCDAEDKEWKQVTSKCKNTTCLIDGLTPHTPYFFRVFAENKVGLSQPCQTPDVTVTAERKPSTLTRLLSFDSDDVFAPDVNEVFTPVCEYGTVSPLSPDEIPFEHREVKVTVGRKFEDLYECQQEVGKGKFGSVYKCIEKGTDKVWAAKILKCREADKGKIRLEIEVMNQLKHPKILMLWDAFEAPRKMILVMEYVGGGELFERVLDDGFDLTERDCIQFMRQICDAVNYMHKRNILHLDLKPENILCIKNESNKIKIIDFGLARFYRPGESTRVLFGTPEFIAPEVVNYEEIGFKTDMWSIGVICYVLLSGLSPFMGDSDVETLSNVTHGEFDFDDESFEEISEDAKHFIDNLLSKDKRKRMTAQQSLDHPWLASDSARLKTRRINTSNLKRFMARRKWQKTGTAIRALGRMTSLQRIFKKDPPNIAAYDSGNGSVSSTSSMSSLDSQTNSSHKQVNPSDNVLDIAKDSFMNQSESNIPAFEDINTEGKISQESKHGMTKHETGLNSEELNHSALDFVTKEDEKIDSSTTLKIKSKPNKTFNKSLPYNVTNPRAVNQLIGKFETACNETENFKKDSKSIAKIELTNRTPARFESTNQIKVKLKSSSELHCTAMKIDETASSCENHDRNELHHSNHNDSRDSESPHFVKEMFDSKAFQGDSVRFDVEFKGNPGPEVIWYFEDDLVSESPRHVIQSLDSGTCSLIIKDVNEDDDGEYICKIVNSTGEETCSAELIVYGAI